MNGKIITLLIFLTILLLVSGCCVPDMPGPIGIPGV